MKVYENSIDILLTGARKDANRRNQAAQDELWPVRSHYFTPTKGTPVGAKTQERALIQLLWGRASGNYQLARESGHVGSFHNCVFRLLYGVFGADIIAYLFNQAWIPVTTIDPFDPALFLKRLNVLENAARVLKDRAKTPVLLPETAPYVAAGMGPELPCFNEKQHRLLLDSSLRELRGFGELGFSCAWRRDKQTVFIYISTPHEFDDPEVDAFKFNPNGLHNEYHGPDDVYS